MRSPRQGDGLGPPGARRTEVREEQREDGTNGRPDARQGESAGGLWGSLARAQTIHGEAGSEGRCGDTSPLEWGAGDAGARWSSRAGKDFSP